MRQIDHDESLSVASLYQRLNEIAAQTPKSAAALKGQALRVEHYKRLIADAEARRNVALQRSAWVNSTCAKLKTDADLREFTRQTLEEAKGTKSEPALTIVHQRAMAGEFDRAWRGTVEALASIHDAQNPEPPNPTPPYHKTVSGRGSATTNEKSQTDRRGAEQSVSSDCRAETIAARRDSSPSIHATEAGADGGSLRCKTARTGGAGRPCPRHSGACRHSCEKVFSAAVLADAAEDYVNGLRELVRRSLSGEFNSDAGLTQFLAAFKATVVTPAGEQPGETT